MDGRKQSGWPFWLTVGLIVTPGLYAASFWPACWLVAHDHLPFRPAAVFYNPILTHTKWFTRFITGDDPLMQLAVVKMMYVNNPPTDPDICSFPKQFKANDLAHDAERPTDSPPR